MDTLTSSGQTRRRRHPIIIVGAHRSGTTATARALELLGLQIGQRLDSHREPKGVQALHEEYLRRCGGTWYNPTPLLQSIQTPQGERQCAEYLADNLRNRFAYIFGYRKNPKGLWLSMRIKLGTPWGWKEPRTTLFAPSWLELFPDARVLHVIRHPLAAAMSIRQRELAFRAGGDPPNTRLDDLDYCLQLVLLYTEAGERLAGRARNYRRIHFEQIQANPGEALNELANFCGLHFTSARLAQAAASIRREIASPWRDVSADTARAFLSRYPALNRLGYEKEKAG
jgi:Sulfotransferase family